MNINWLGHSCFVIKGNRTTIITDPFSPDSGYSLGKATADIVTVSHQHAGHSNFSGIGGEPKLISEAGEYEIGGVLIIGMATFHDSEKGSKRGKNTVYLIEVDEVSVCHLGDLGHTLTDDQVEELENIDVLMLPVGGVSTLNAAEAAEVVRQIEPKIAIPMHYQTDAYEGELEPVDRFLKEMGVTGVEPQSRLTITKSNLPISTQVFLLTY